MNEACANKETPVKKTFIDDAIMGSISPCALNIRILTYNKTWGTRCYKGLTYSGEATNDSGLTTATLKDGKIIKMTSYMDMFTYSLREVYDAYGKKCTILYMNGMYLDELEFESLFPQTAMYFKLKGMEIDPLFSCNLDRLAYKNMQDPYSSIKGKNFISIDGDTTFEVGVLHI